MSTETKEPSSRSLMPLGILAAILFASFALVFAPTNQGFDGARGANHSFLSMLGGIAPFALSAVIAYLAPRDVGKGARATIAVIVGFIALFVSRMATESTEGGPESSTLLSWLLGLPIGTGIFILFLPRQSPKLIQGVTLVSMLGTLALSMSLLAAPMGRAFHFNQDIAWIPSFGIRYHVALDGISLWLVILTTFIVPIATYASFGSVTTRMKDWCFSLLLLQGAMIGAFVSLDLFLFYVFWELMLVPMYLMIGVWGGDNRRYAATKFFLYTMVGSVLMLGAILYLAYAYQKLAGVPSFDYFDLQRVMLPQHIQVFLFGAFLLSFVIKVPMFPVHTWLPDAHTEAPTAGSIILAAVMLKLGTYGYLRFNLGLFPEASHWAGANLAGVAVLGGILYGALCAW